MIEDIEAQNHQLVDTLTFDQARIALSALQTLSNHQAGRGQRSPFAQLLGMSVQTMDAGQATVTLDVKHHHMNLLGIAHGGVAYSLADQAGGLAAVTLLSGQFVVTQDLQLRYHAPARVGTLRAEAQVKHKGSRTIIANIDLYQVEELVASATGCYAILNLKESSERGIGTSK